VLKINVYINMQTPLNIQKNLNVVNHRLINYKHTCIIIKANSLSTVRHNGRSRNKTKSVPI